MRVFANTGKNIQDLASVGLRILHTVCSDERQLMRAGKVDQLAIYLFFATNEMALKFNTNVFAAECVDEKFRAILRLLGSTGCQPVASGSLPDALCVCTRGLKRGLRQAAANYRLAACAPRSKERDQTFSELR